jgi:SH3-like domain-containing protein
MQASWQTILFMVILIAAMTVFAAPGSWAQEKSTGATGQSDTADEPPAEKQRFQRPGQTGLPLPRFVSLRSGEVNLRTGPGVRYPIDWVYKRRNLPVEIIDEFDTWRRIRDWQGTVGWVHQSMLQGRRTVLVTGRERLLRREPHDGAPGLAQAETGVIGDLKRCRGVWCEVELEGFSGWLRMDEFYGIYPQEVPSQEGG